MYDSTKKKVQDEKNEKQIQKSNISIDGEKSFTIKQRKKIFQYEMKLIVVIIWMYPFIM